jgi:hypothetical protein
VAAVAAVATVTAMATVASMTAVTPGREEILEDRHSVLPLLSALL